MKNYIAKTFARMDLPQIREFLLYGTEQFTDSETEPYDIRLKQESDPIYKRLNSLYADSEEKDKAYADLSQALTAYMAVYMEMGMKAGARLIYQLLLSDDPTPSKEGSTT